MNGLDKELDEIMQEYMCDVIEGTAIGFTVCDYDEAIQAIKRLIDDAYKKGYTARGIEELTKGRAS